jgi:general secretion pathway protein I
MCYPKTDKNSAGFTLIEVLAAISILAVVLVALFKMHLQTISMNSEVGFYTQAVLLAQSKMAESESAPWDDITENSGDFGKNFPGYTWKMSVQEVESEELGPYADNLKRVDIAVALNQDEFLYTIRAYILKEL